MNDSLHQLISDLDSVLGEGYTSPDIHFVSSLIESSARLVCQHFRLEIQDPQMVFCWAGGYLESAKVFNQHFLEWKSSPRKSLVEMLYFLRKFLLDLSSLPQQIGDRPRSLTTDFLTDIFSIKAVIREVKRDSLWVELLHPDSPCVVLEWDENQYPIRKNKPGFSLYLHGLNIHDGNLRAELIVLEPDHLLDVTTIAECNQDYTVSALLALKRRFEPMQNTSALMLGNFANFAVDRLFTHQGNAEDFDEVLQDHFQLSPFEYLTCPEFNQRQRLENFINEAKAQYQRLELIINEKFQIEGLDLEEISLEPSFFSPMFGLKGRLDILYSFKGKHYIIELKSGKPPYTPDPNAIKPSHLSQLYLYHLLLPVPEKQDPLKRIQERIEGFILYSKPQIYNLRKVNWDINEIKRIIRVRNEILLLEKSLSNDRTDECLDLFKQINKALVAPDLNPSFKGLIEQNFNEFQRPFRSSTNELAQRYVAAMSSYVALEHWLNLTGLHQAPRDGANLGLSGLWLRTREEKKQRFELLDHLQILENKIDTEERSITFLRQDTGQNFVALRPGDQVVVYPYEQDEDNAGRYAVHKANIIDISPKYIRLRFNFRQRNTRYFDKYSPFGHWTIEKDFPEIGFTAMYRSLYEFLQTPLDFQNLLLAQRPPKHQKLTPIFDPEDLDEHQKRILQKAVEAQEYFVLNGPPGTGKTSFIIKNLIRYYARQNKKILVLAYTNRAVDELCEAAHQAEVDFVRIGNELQCQNEWKKYLLNHQIEHLKKHRPNGKIKRNDLRDFLNTKRVYLSTLASVTSKNFLFQLIAFDLIIVDEASQILEPQIIGVLCRVPKFIMIGDHRQLPAISVQPMEKSAVKDRKLKNIGLENRALSLFERLFRTCQKKGWKHALDTLYYQGRMHREIARFPSQYFYQNKLKPAIENPNISPETHQILKRQSLDFDFYKQNSTPWQEKIASSRLVLIPHKYANPGDKHHPIEAQIILKILHHIEKNKDKITPHTVGVITPFRNQIALIQGKIETAGLKNPERITIDTVERYQGGQRDIILFSVSINSPSQIASLQSMDTDNRVDRKLNVALTRAREQIIILCNTEILSENPLYAQLIQHYTQHGVVIPAEEICPEISPKA